VLPQFFEQVRAEHEIAVLAALAAANMHHHALAVDVRDFKIRQFGAPQSDAYSVIRMVR
jgi:hypothetical protein